jgi:L-aminopeptidase/D-esterase-like protein
MRVGNYTFGAVAVVNALGDVLDFDNTGVDSLTALTQMAHVDAPLTNTTITAIATDAPLSRTSLQLIARAGSSAIVRRIAPANTVFDGDVVFALSTAQDIYEFQPAELLVFSAAAQLCLEHAIVRAVQ